MVGLKCFSSMAISTMSWVRRSAIHVWKFYPNTRTGSTSRSWSIQWRFRLFLLSLNLLPMWRKPCSHLRSWSARECLRRTRYRSFTLSPSISFGPWFCDLHNQRISWTTWSHQINILRIRMWWCRSSMFSLLSSRRSLKRFPLVARTSSRLIWVRSRQRQWPKFIRTSLLSSRSSPHFCTRNISIRFLQFQIFSSVWFFSSSEKNRWLLEFLKLGWSKHCLCCWTVFLLRSSAGVCCYWLLGCLMIMHLIPRAELTRTQISTATRWRRRSLVLLSCILRVIWISSSICLQLSFLSSTSLSLTGVMQRQFWHYFSILVMDAMWISRTSRFEVVIGSSSDVDRFVSLLSDLFHSGILVKHFHFSILLVGMDIISRYQPLLAPLEPIRYDILSVFMTGLNSNRERVRNRAVTSLSRFVSAIKEGIVPFQQGILDAVQVCFCLVSHRSIWSLFLQRMIWPALEVRLLTLKPTTPFSTSLRLSSQDHGMQRAILLPFTTYYVVILSHPVCFLSSSYKHPECSAAVARSTDRSLSTWDLCFVLRKGLAIAINVGCLSSLLRGIISNSLQTPFSLQGTMKEEMVQLLQLYTTLLPIALMHDAPYLQSQIDQLIHRLVSLLNDDLWASAFSMMYRLPYIPTLCASFCKIQSYRSLEKCLDVLGQMFARCKEKAATYIDQILPTVTEHVFASYSGDEEIIGFFWISGWWEGKKVDLIAKYYAFLDSVIMYIPAVLLSSTNAPFLSQYLGILLEGVTSTSSMAVTKVCISCFRKLAGCWMDPSTQTPGEVVQWSVADK